MERDSVCCCRRATIGEKALAIARRVGDRLLEVETGWNLGRAHAASGELLRAAELMQARLDYDREMQLPRLEADSAVVRELKARFGRDA